MARNKATNNKAYENKKYINWQIFNLFIKFPKSRFVLFLPMLRAETADPGGRVSKLYNNLTGATVQAGVMDPTCQQGSTKGKIGEKARKGHMKNFKYFRSYFRIYCAK